jgi:TonB family protein
VNVMPLRTFVLAVSFFLGFNAAAGSQQETAEQFIERVKKAISNEEWGRAQSGIKHALSLKPESPEANFIAAQVYWHEGARSQAIAFLVNAIKLQPTYPEAHLLLAKYLRELNKLDEARDEVTIAINQGVPLFSAYCLLSEIHIANGDLNSASSSLESAIRFSTDAQSEGVSSLHEKIAQARELLEKLHQFSELEAAQKGNDVTIPQLLKPAYPSYTEEARTLKIQGAVLLEILINANGDVESVILFRGLGHGLDERAIDAAGKLKFSPAMRSGRPISYWQRITVEFNLR